MKLPIQLAFDLLHRSTCSVQVSAVIFARDKILSYGWNNMGHDGLGQHAELHALSRVRFNKKLLTNSEIVVLGKRRRNNSIVMSLPCANCLRYLQAINIQCVTIQDKANQFHRIKL